MLLLQGKEHAEQKSIFDLRKYKVMVVDIAVWALLENRIDFDALQLDTLICVWKEPYNVLINK